MSGINVRRWVVALAIVTFGCQEKPKPLPNVEIPVPNETPKSNQSPRILNDVHTHLNPYAIDLFVSQMDKNGIRRVVNMSGGAGQERQALSILASERHPGRIAPFMNVNWEGVEDKNFGAARANDLRTAVQKGFAGLKVSKALGLGVTIGDQYLAVDDVRLDPLWTEAGRLGVVVGIHTSDPKAFFEKPGPQNERHAELSYAPSWSFYGDEFPSREELLAARDRVVSRHRGTTFMLLHFANNPEDIEYVDRLLDANPNVIVDIAARVGEIGRHDANRVREIFEKHQDRILFATDIQMSVIPKDNKAYLRLTLGSVSEEPPTLEHVAPFYDTHFEWLETTGEAIDHPVPIQGNWKVNPLGLSEHVLRKVYYENSERLIFAPWLGRTEASRVISTAKAR